MLIYLGKLFYDYDIEQVATTLSTMAVASTEADARKKLKDEHGPVFERFLTWMFVSPTNESSRCALV